MMHRFQAVARRSIKTLHTPIITIKNDPAKRLDLLFYLNTLNKVLTSAQYNNTILYENRYKHIPEMITSKDSYKLHRLIEVMVENWEKKEILSKSTDPQTKLGKIGLRIFLDICANFNKDIDYLLATTLAVELLKIYVKIPTKETVDAIENVLTRMSVFLSENKLMLDLTSRASIDNICRKLFSKENSDVVIKTLEKLDYKLVSSDLVRVVRGKKFTTELEVNKGWKYYGGIKDNNPAYLRSLGISESSRNKLISLDETALVLFIDDKVLRDANKILPTLHYCNKEDKSLVIFINGDVKGDALNAISIHNNKSSRQNKKSKILIFNYVPGDHRGLEMTENYDFIKFCKLPKGSGSIYSQKFSEYVPSKITKDLYFGEIESVKATTLEAFLYNENDINGNECLRTTVTVHIGGSSELEIDQKRVELDTIFNDFLASALSDGVLPTYGVSLVKALSCINNVNKPLFIPIFAELMENSIKNVYKIDKFTASARVAKTLLLGDSTAMKNSETSNFGTAYLNDTFKKINMFEVGLLEPWKKIDNTLKAILSFIKMATTCDYFVTKVYKDRVK
ncbi:related to Mitochondrial chaperone TCM62 [Saccharomycodes ludwigii]|uniref:Related to Mitochondrial chaperone TCM62 n=1 Tax=Saccharomycodes ludwigii TaxID=36035 RepID=A0A376BB37_9ASCO|nr:hypothetical protein SCDLUD_003616 [Saccharomycodes ludwigii]KAH3900623.1 hypothetical protein SCDLUD_003616 [Saccharomycodes ludwigii]SSD61774.1 related to Mitochondrial chaperone TCM62 [Saccharomycodes ludwigii]